MVDSLMLLWPIMGRAIRLCPVMLQVIGTERVNLPLSLLRKRNLRTDDLEGAVGFHALDLAPPTG